MTFDEALNLVLRHEGGYVNHPSDPGGETNMGISKRAYPDLDIANLTIEQVAEIYKRDYWNRMRCDDLPEPVRYEVFDCAVNSGCAFAGKLLQRAAGTPEDGVVGPKTVAAAKAKDPIRLVGMLSAFRLMHVSNLQTFKTFGQGWAQRIASNLLDAMQRP